MIRKLSLAAISVSIMTLGLAACASYKHDTASRPVTLTVQNSVDEPLRCVGILAHYITEDFAPIQPGGSLSMTFKRFANGSLGRGEHKGEPMWLENVRCGIESEWQATDVVLPIMPVREGRTTKTTCRLSGDHLDCL